MKNLTQLSLFIALSLNCFQFSAKAQTPIISTCGGNGTNGYSGDGGPATAAEMSFPDGMAIDKSGNVYSAEAGSHHIRMINGSGIISTVAGNGTAGFSGDGSAATVAEINTPTDVAVDKSGNIYIADEHNNRIRMINTSGIISTIAGTGTAGFSGDGAAATAAELNLPAGVAVDSLGNIYIADYKNSRIREINTSGVITTIAGTGTAGYNGDGISATTAELNYPIGVAVYPTGDIYIADNDNNRVRKVNISGTISTVAGNGTAGYAGDGAAATASEMNWPTRVYLDNSGNLYISDWGNGCVREISGGIITTIAGTGTQGFSGDGGPATSAELSHPTGAVVNASTGVIYIDDEQNHRVRKITSCNNIFTSINESNADMAQVILYPNPGNGLIYISLNGMDISKMDISIIDMLGRVVDTYSDKNVSNGMISLNERNLNNGIYFYRLISSDKIIATGKFIIAK